MKNKRAQVPEAVLLLLVIAICGTALYYSVMYKSDKAEVISLFKSLEIYNDAEKLEIYLGEASNLALQEAYEQAASMPVICPERIWSETCRPNNQEIKNKLKLNFDESLAKYTDKKFSSEVKDKLNVQFDSINFNTSNENKFLKYNIAYLNSLSFSLDYPDLNFEKIYSDITAKKSECDKRFETNTEADRSTKIMRCINEARFNDWDAAIASSEKYYRVTLTSKKSYFYDNTFKKIKLEFALNK